jgi:magnesium-protoporphyrin IX monomethyl ester (oxidative) cyclase
MAAWLPALEHLQPPSGVTRVRYDRFSPYHQRPGKYGLTLAPASAAAHVYPLPRRELLDLTYYFLDEGRPDAFSGAGGEIMAARPAVQAIQARVRSWVIAFWMGDPPVLTVEDDGEGLDVEDTRSCAMERRYRLTGLDRAVYLAAEDAPLKERLAARQDLEGDVAAAIERLERRSLVLTLDRRLLAIGLHGPLPVLPGISEFPGGMVEEGARQWA